MKMTLIETGDFIIEHDIAARPDGTIEASVKEVTIQPPKKKELSCASCGIVTEIADNVLIVYMDDVRAGPGAGA